MALDRLPVSGAALCSQSTVSRLENLPRRAELGRRGDHRSSARTGCCPDFPRQESGYP